MYVAEGIEKEKRVGLDLPQAVKEEPPSSPDMLIKEEQLDNASSRRRD